MTCSRAAPGAVRRASASARIGQVVPGEPRTCASFAGMGGTPDKAPFGQAIDDFYLTNPIARASAVMAECSALAESRTMTAAE